jgi:hypothetical protein
MLLTGNYRCIQEDAARSIKEAVHSDIDQSRSMYNWVAELCKALGLGAGSGAIRKYANAAQGLSRPSSCGARFV